MKFTRPYLVDCNKVNINDTPKQTRSITHSWFEGRKNRLV